MEIDKKYELLKDDTIKLFQKITAYRIRALRDFNWIKKGDLGGYIQSEANLSHEGNCWLYDKAKVFDKAVISGDTRIFDRALIYNKAHISGEIYISGNAHISGNTHISGTIYILGDTHIFGNAHISGKEIRIFGGASISGNAHIQGPTDIFWMSGFGSAYRTTTVFRDSLIPGGWRVNCGCFTGSIERFEEKIEETYPKTTDIYRKPYKSMVNLIKDRINITKN